MSFSGRCECLNLFADAVEGVENEIAEIDANETGVLLSLTRQITSSLKDIFRQVSCGIGTMSEKFVTRHGPLTIDRVPWGPTAVIAPWNVPGGTVAPKFAVALLCGAPVILKSKDF